jgi:hypothetical protein
MPIKDVRAGGELQRTRLRLRLGLASGPAIGNTPASAGMKRSEIGSRSSSARAVAVSIAADDRGPRLGACSRTDRGPAVHDDAREGGLAMAWMGKPDTKVSELCKEPGVSRQNPLSTTHFPGSQEATLVSRTVAARCVGSAAAVFAFRCAESPKPPTPASR